MIKEVDYIDLKAQSIHDFDIISTHIWDIAKMNCSPNDLVSLLEPCVGGGKLISLAPEKWIIEGYEPDYAMYKMANGMMVTQKRNNAKIHNSDFESVCINKNFYTYDLIVSIPYTNKGINPEKEKGIDYLNIKNYGWYVLIRSIDLLTKGGIGIFALPATLLGDVYSYEKEWVAKKCIILSNDRITEKNDYVVLTIKKM